MPKSTAAALSALRDEVFARDGSCRWPGCVLPTTDAWGYEHNPLEMAHLVHRGMGGSRERNTLANVVVLCRAHHALLDGRVSELKLRWELNEMLRYVVNP